MSQDHTWQQASKQERLRQRYTLTVGEYQALVWYQTTGDWSALISRDHTAVNTNLFNNLMTAQTWCEQRLAELDAQGLLMQWIPDPTDKAPERYSLTTGTCTVVAWNSGRHGYAATVKSRSMTTAKYGFSTLEDAQGWCLAELAELRATGRCDIPSDEQHVSS